MPHFAKWLWWILAAIIFLAVPVIAYYDERYAFDVLRSLANGETSIGFWLKHGLPFRNAVVIAIFCGNYELFGWLYLFSSIRDGYNKTYSWFIGFFRNHIERATTTKTWARRFWWLTEKTYRFCVPRPSNDLRTCNTETAQCKLRYYLPLVFYGFCPGYIWTGVGYSLSFRLNLLIAYFVLALFNALKMICAGYLTIKIGIWGVFAIVVTMPFTKWGIEKLLRAFQKKPD